MSAIRPLPSHPSLEFDRKQAKALHRQLRAANPLAVARANAHHHSLSRSSPADIRLADAQLIVAREYGFNSWPRLVHYYAGIARQKSVSPQQLQAPEYYHGSVRSLLEGHKAQGELAGRTLAAYVPRFYGLRIAEVFTLDVTEDEARLAVARSSACPSWEVLLECAAAAAQDRTRDDAWAQTPRQQADNAIRSADLVALQKIVSANPQFAGVEAEAFGLKLDALLYSAVDAEREHGRETMKPIVDWLVEEGHDLQVHLNMRLCGHIYMKTEQVRWLLERGADANWVAPNGIAVIEHALLRYWNGDAIDLLAKRARTRKSLWICAGLGDIKGVSRFLDTHGCPTPAARQDRPPLDAIGAITWPALPDADDEEILWEVFLVALLNGRTNVMEYMIARGYNMDSRLLGWPVVNIAVGNAWTKVAECLIRNGANLDLRGWDSNGTARELAREMWENGSHGPDYRYIVELCGLDPDAILAERDARPLPVPRMMLRVQKALDLANDDAVRQGQLDVRPENLLFGLLREGGLPRRFFTESSGMDRERFYAELQSRVEPSEPRTESTTLPLHASAQAVVDAATRLAAERRRTVVSGLHVLSALLSDEGGVAADILTRFGADPAALQLEVTRAY